MTTLNKVQKPKKSSPIWGVFTLILLILVILKFFVYQQVTVVGSSMEPNYDDGQLLMVNQINKKFQRGQVVAVYADKEVALEVENSDFISGYLTRFTARFFLKRIIGLPGESIEIVDDKVIIYSPDFPEGYILNEPYLTAAVRFGEKQRSFYFPKTLIPQDSYFVMGDNRSNSTDSRSSSLGPVPSYSIFGIETIRFWPIKTVSLFQLPEYSFSEIDSEVLDRKAEILSQQQQNQRLIILE